MSEGNAKEQRVFLMKRMWCWLPLFVLGPPMFLVGYTMGGGFRDVVIPEGSNVLVSEANGEVSTASDTEPSGNNNGSSETEPPFPVNTDVQTEWSSPVATPTTPTVAATEPPLPEDNDSAPVWSSEVSPVDPNDDVLTTRTQEPIVTIPVSPVNSSPPFQAISLTTKPSVSPVTSPPTYQAIRLTMAPLPVTSPPTFQAIRLTAAPTPKNVQPIPAPITSFAAVATTPPVLRTTSNLSSNMLRSGPLIGHVTSSTARVWAFQGEGRSMKLVYWKLNDTNQKGERVMDPNTRGDASKIELTGLDHSSWYIFELRLRSDDQLLAEGQFQTAPMVDQPSKFQYVLASCMDNKGGLGYKHQPVWDALLNQRLGRPDFAVLPGDTVYMNDQDWDDTGKVLEYRQRIRNLDQRDEKHFANFLRQIPTYTTWDDHDYGKNNADRTQPGKETALATFDSLWANPNIGNLPSLPGNFYSFKRADVEFFVLDARYHRDRNTDRPFGSGQMDWLKEGLRSSSSTFKILISAVDFTERGFAEDTYELGAFLKQNRISGVILNAGDIHRNEFKTTVNDGWPYLITQITSSGISKGWRRPFAIISVDTTLADPEIKASFYAADSTALDPTWRNDSSLQCTSILDNDRTRESFCTQTIRLSDLTP